MMIGRSEVAISVHPRWCGEHIRRRRKPQMGAGSSPLVRGTYQPEPVRTRHRRFIPAGAGNMAWEASRMGMMTVHPRWCGEHAIASSLGDLVSGSSPLVRGTYWPWSS